MTWKQRVSGLVLALALTLQVSFGVTDTTSTEWIRGSDPSYDYKPVDVNDLLSCKPQDYTVTTRLIGPKGGRVKVGTHLLQIPEGALNQDVAITAEQITGSTNSVRLSPEGLTFKVPAELTMSYANCTEVMLPKRIAYTTELLKILEGLPSKDKVQSRTVVSPIDHFSRYAVAY